MSDRETILRYVLAALLAGAFAAGIINIYLTYR